MSRLIKWLVLVVSVGSAAAALAACGAVITRAESAPVPVAANLVQVDDVAVEFGQGSPYPVNVSVGLNLPSPCAQVNQIAVALDGRTFQLTIATDPAAGAACPPDSLPYRLSLPLNMAGLGPGRYTVTVNGRSADFDFPPPAGR